MGPERHYDVLGASQFRLLCALGLRADHRVLDFGCGSLRAGRLLIPYLDPGRYFGVEPNAWLIEMGIEKELGADLVRLKSPRFDHNAEFLVDGFGQSFDFILAQSIFSHCGPDLVARALINFSGSLADDGLIAATFLNGIDYPGTGWIYPKCATHSVASVQRMVEAAGLTAIRAPWFHPRQHWWLMARDADQLPDQRQLAHLTGVVLRDPDFRASWSAAAGVRKGFSRWYKFRVLAGLRRWLARRRNTESRGI